MRTTLDRRLPRFGAWARRGAAGGADPVLGVGALRARARRQSAAAAVAVIAVTLLSAGLLLPPYSVNAAAIAGALAVPFVLVWVWRRPVRGVYVLLAAAVMQEATLGPAYPDDIAHDLLFFEDLSTISTHLKGLPYSPAELLMGFVLLAWLLKDVAARRFRFDRGSLMLPLGLYMLMILVGEAHGLLTHGDFTLSLWEIRGQGYMFILYLLTCNLVKTRQVETLVWIVLGGAGLKGVQGVFRYAVDLHGSLGGARQLFEHAQSYFFNAAITLAVVLLLYGGPRRMKRVALALLPVILVADLANERRAAVLALAVGLCAVLVVTLFAHAPRRRLVLAVLLAGAVLWPVYYAHFQQDASLFGEPAHAVASIYNPSPGDASSNLYRQYEDSDLLYTMKTSPIIGYGFGKSFLTPYALIDVGYVFATLVPHNSILWVWMRLGSVGYLLFWLLIGTSMVQAIRLALRLRDPYLKGLAVLILSLVMQEVIVGYLDIQWSGGRNLIAVGVLFGLLSRLALVAPSDRRADIRPVPRQEGRDGQAVPAPADAAAPGLAVVTMGRGRGS